MPDLSKKEQTLRQIIWDYYTAHPRVFPWRETNDPYAILVSEIMLQQTQTDRVIPKYEAFLQAFPTVAALAKADLADVLRYWQGLGYNRRGMNLWKLAQVVVLDFNGVIPHDNVSLVSLPGIGAYTAGAVQAFAFRQPIVMIETNIRRVYIHHFFADEMSVSDNDILPLIEKTVDHENPREWYYALMDYGAYLKTQIPNPNRRSKHYTKQSKFEGSDRQIRGEMLRKSLAGEVISVEDIAAKFTTDVSRVRNILLAVQAEGFPILTSGA